MKSVYVVFDKVLGKYGAPVFLEIVPNQCEYAGRWFKQGLKSLPPECGRVPADFDLYELGVYDSACAAFEVTKPLFVMNGHVEVKENE